MKHLAAYLLLGLGGNEAPSGKDIETVLESVGIDADPERLKTLLAELKGKNIAELIEEGNKKLASVPSGGATVAAPASGGGAGGGAAAPADAGKEDAKQAEAEESDEDMGLGLFD